MSRHVARVSGSAHAGSAAVCPEQRPLFDGWERADPALLGEQMARLRSFAEPLWGRDEPAPPEEVERIREEVVAIVTGVAPTTRTCSG